MKEPVAATLNKRIGFGARLGRNSGIVLAVLFGLVLALIVSLIVDEGMRERTLIAFPALSTASSEFGSGLRWTDLRVTYPDGRTEEIRHDVRVSVGSEITVYMVPDEPETLQRRKPSVAKMVSRSWGLLAFSSAGFLLGAFLVARAMTIKWDAQNTRMHGTPYFAEVTHVGTVWLPGTLRFVGYIKWRDTGGKTARSMTLTTQESDQFKVGDKVAVRAGSKRDWLLCELDLLA